MRQVFLIAWREYKQYVFSRGFLLFIVMFPLGLVAFTAAMGLIERTKPTRAFVVYDQTGAYADDIDREVERRYLLEALAGWDAYLRVNAREGVLADEILPGLPVGGASDDSSPIPSPFAPDEISDARLRAFQEAGGFDAAQAAARPFLKSNIANFTMPRPQFERIDLPTDVSESETLAQAEERLRPYLLEQKGVRLNDGEVGKLFAAILIPEGFSAAPEAPAAQYWSRNLTDNALESLVDNALETALKREAVAELGLSQAALDEVSAIAAPFDSFRPDREAEEAQLGIQDRIETAMPAALTYMLLVIIFGVGNLLLTNTIEERSNKIVEILLSSVTAGQLMMGKLIGIAAVGLTMPAIFLIGGLGASFIGASGDENFIAIAIGSLFSSPLLLIYFFYFFCAYLIFAMIFLAIGAVSNSLQDAQSYMGPVMLLVFAPLPFMIMVFQNPNGFIASVLTWIPIYTPYAVMMRAAADPPLWEIVGATALMLAFALVLIRFMGRIFRNAILQASPPKMREVWRLARKQA
ncbi:ABC transporter permease [Hyphococcus flavus]|uniref:ABC transporter permease n=1 Tax=Hyphococcus flavus TaxID=1866326 RepID=A0AAF0CIK6_9PROT|nr:ABC transporter permease [Hyphococcus flavus]WDI32952.1 ABC transporter permease [Hyphococcus flavus]